MDCSKDFEITDDGVLIGYHGSGGEVVIPEGVRYVARDGVFDPSVEITKLHLPSTLIGHRHDDSCNWSFVADAKPAEGVDHYDSYLPAEAYSKEALKFLYKHYLFNVLSLDLPHLISYEVAKENHIYSTMDGMLLMGEYTILDIPRKGYFPFELDLSYGEYDRYPRLGDSHKGPALVLRCDDDKTLADLKESIRVLGLYQHLSNPTLVYALNLTNSDNDDVEDFFPIGSYCVLIAPKFDFRCLGKSSYLKTHMLLGYACAPELYDAERAKEYTHDLIMREYELYAVAHNHGLYRAAVFIEQRWAKKDMYTGFDYMDFTEIVPLVEAVLFGSVDDVAATLDRYWLLAERNEGVMPLGGDCDDCCYNPYIEFDTTDAGLLMQKLIHVVPLACRYGGVDKVKCILNSKLFNIEVVKENKDYVSIHQIGLLHRFMLGMLDYEEETCPAPIGISGEACNVKPISPEERIECLGYWIAYLKDEDESKQWQCFFAHVLGCSDLVATLSAEVDMQDFIKTYMESSSYRDLEESVQSLIIRCPDDAIAYLKVRKSLGFAPMTLDGALESIIMAGRSQFHDLFDLIEVNEDGADEIMDHMIEYNDREILQVLFDSEAKISYETFKYMANLAVEKGLPDLAAEILQAQNRRKLKGDSSAASLTSLTL